MTSPLGVAALPFWTHVLIGLALCVGVGVPSFVGLLLLLDDGATRHTFLHWRYRSLCGRCEQAQQLKREIEHQKWLKKREAAGPVSLHLEKPKGARHGA